RDPVDVVAGYRNGFGKPRRLKLEQRDDHAAAGARARPRGTLRESAAPGVQAPYRRGRPAVAGAVPAGLAQGDFDLALRGLLGDGAPLSAPSLARLKAGWHAEDQFWMTRSVAAPELGYV